MSSLTAGEQAIPDQHRPHFPILGFAAGTPLLTADGYKRIEDIKPGDFIQAQADDSQGDDMPQAHDHDRNPPRWWEDN